MCRNIYVYIARGISTHSTFTHNTHTYCIFTGIIAASMAVMAFLSYNANHFCDDYNTSNNHAIRAPNELVVDSGGTASQAESNGAMSFTGAISAVCLGFMTDLIQSAYAIGSR